MARDFRYIQEKALVMTAGGYVKVGILLQAVMMIIIPIFFPL